MSHLRLIKDAHVRDRWSIAAQGAWIVVAFLLPISGALLPVPFVLALILGGVHLLRTRPKFPKAFIGTQFLWYFLHVVGMVWTSDVAFGAFDLQVKSGLLLASMVGLGLIATEPRMLRWTMVAFTCGIVLSMLLGAFKAWDCYEVMKTASCFSQSTLSFQLHPSYAAWYACWAMAWWGQYAIDSSETKDKLGAVVLSILLLTWIMLLASKSGVIGAVVVICWLMIHAISRTSGRVRSLVIGTVALAIVVGSAVQGRLVVARMQASIAAVERAFSGDPKLLASADGNDLRLVAWACSLQRLGQYPFGSGTGDVKHALRTCYGERGAEQALVHDLNSHSQILQGAVALGWPGIFLTALMLLFPLAMARSRQTRLAFIFMTLLFLNAMVESVLEVQAGVVFVGMSLGLFALHGRTSPNNVASTEPYA